MHFLLQNSIELKSYGWGACVRFSPNCSRAVVFFAHHAMFIADFVRQRYSECFEASEDFYIDYETVAIDEKGVAYNYTDDPGIFYFHIGSSKIYEIANDAKVRARVPLVCCAGNIAYATDTGIHIRSITENPTEILIKRNVDPSSKLLFHPSGSYIVIMNSSCISANQTNSGIEMWDITPTEWFTRNDFWEFTHDGKYFILCPYEESIRVCNALTGRELAFFRKGNDDDVTEAHLSSDGNLLISSSCDGRLRVWDFEKALQLSRGGAYKSGFRGEDNLVLKGSLTGHKEKGVSSVSPSPDFKTAISYTRWDRTFYLWDLKSGQLLGQQSFQCPVDDYKILWNGSNARLFVAENSDGVSYDKALPYRGPGHIRISETIVR